MSPTDTPESDSDDPPPGKIAAWVFWTALGFGLACVLLGAGVGVWGARMAPPAARADRALASLAHAAEGSAPFSRQTDAAAKTVPVSDDLTALRGLAATGVPSRHDLAGAFPKAAAQAAGAAGHAPTIAGVAETVPDAVLARAKAAADRGDLQLALCVIAALPPKGQAALTPWREAARKRVAVEQRLAALKSSTARP